MNDRPKKSAKKRARADFDEAYYGRFYESEGTRVYGHEEQEKLAQAIVSLTSYWGLEVTSVLDVGAGTGHMRAVWKKRWPRVRYTSTEASAYACEKYGHERLDISRESLSRTFDLVICQGVLPYLDDRGASAAIRNIAKMATGFVYVEAVTADDLRKVCDTRKTDLSIFARSASFYETRLSREFKKLGAGLYYARKGPLAFYELETCRGGPRRSSRRAAAARRTSRHEESKKRATGS